MPVSTRGGEGRVRNGGGATSARGATGVKPSPRTPGNGARRSRAASGGADNGHTNGHTNGNGRSHGNGAGAAPNGGANGKLSATAGNGSAGGGDPALAPYVYEKGVRWDMLGLAVVFAISTFALSTVLRLASEELPAGTLRLPTSLEAAQALGSALADFTETHYWNVVGAHAATYIYLQTFAIPGTVFVNLLGGALLGMWVGFPLCLCYNTIGSVFLYWLSKRFGGRLSRRFLRQRLADFAATLDEHCADSREAGDGGWRGGWSLWTYMTSIRVFPFTPNWFMNVAAAQLRVRLVPFAAAVFVGLTPYNYVSCRAGLILAQLRSRSDIMDARLTGQLAAIALLGLALPTIGRRFGLLPESGGAKSAKKKEA